ncbi:hypothetical protein SCHPADRAFT_890562 [Schizopora paradoxa]|uniref:Uncharacterized protein n=1 Tax=Schizopora paradoxa TaxID=27342 RepID=A0A0H2S7F0_9AGAM|nr:hypothetical protein SCHPADRAFT_890562 [Schizopora paradoxa]
MKFLLKGPRGAKNSARLCFKWRCPAQALPPKPFTLFAPALAYHRIVLLPYGNIVMPPQGSKCGGSQTELVVDVEVGKTFSGVSYAFLRALNPDSISPTFLCSIKLFDLNLPLFTVSNIIHRRKTDADFPESSRMLDLMLDNPPAYCYCCIRWGVCSNRTSGTQGEEPFIDPKFVDERKVLRVLLFLGPRTPTITLVMMHENSSEGSFSRTLRGSTNPGFVKRSGRVVVHVIPNSQPRVPVTIDKHMKWDFWKHET